MSKLKVLNSKLFFYYNFFIQKPKYAKQIQHGKNSDFDHIKYVSGFDIKPNSQIFVHAGLKSIKMVTGDDYQDIISKLIKALQEVYSPNSIIVPSFTPSFRKTGVYSKNYSKGEYGVFSELPRHQADMRTDDAIHGVAIFTKDTSKFDNIDYQDTFSENELYATLKKNTYILNISTNFFVSTYMHYIEEDLKVPYKKNGGLESKGILLDENNQPKKIVQNNHHYLYRTEINREKVKRTLEKNNALNSIEYLGLKSSCIAVEDLDAILREEISKDPYYLVTP